MKKEIIISIVLAIVGLMFIISLLTGTPSQPKLSTPTPSVLQTQQNTSQETTKTVFTLSEVNKHATENDCWIIINTVVYNVSSYNQNHPGGSLRAYCGKDATQGYDNKSGRGSHSSRANALLVDMAIGNISP